MECFTFNSSIRGYHVYRSVWNYRIGDKLNLEIEEDNSRDKFAIKLLLLRGNLSECVGHVPAEFSKIFYY